MLYTQEQFESVPARDLLDQPHRWISGNAAGSENNYVAHRIRTVLWKDQFIRVLFEMREGSQVIDERDRRLNVITWVFLGDKPFAWVERLVPPAQELLVLKREFEPERDDDEETEDE